MATVCNRGTTQKRIVRGRPRPGQHAALEGQRAGRGLLVAPGAESRASPQKVHSRLGVLTHGALLPGLRQRLVVPNACERKLTGACAIARLSKLAGRTSTRTFRVRLPGVRVVLVTRRLSPGLHVSRAPRMEVLPPKLSLHPGLRRHGPSSESRVACVSAATAADSASARVGAWPVARGGLPAWVSPWARAHSHVTVSSSVM